MSREIHDHSCGQNIPKKPLSLLLLQGGDSTHKATALNSIYEQVNVTPIQLKGTHEPNDIPYPEELIFEKALNFFTTFISQHLNSQTLDLLVADVTSTLKSRGLNGHFLISRKPGVDDLTDLADHISNTMDAFGSHSPTLCEVASIALFSNFTNQSDLKTRPALRITSSQIKIKFPGNPLRDRGIAKDLVASSPLNTRLLSIPDGIDPLTTIVFLAEINKLEGHRPADLITLPINYAHWLTHQLKINPDYLESRLEMYSRMERIPRNAGKYFSPAEVCALLDSAHNAAPHALCNLLTESTEYTA